MPNAETVTRPPRRWHYPWLAAVLAVAAVPVAVAIQWHITARMLQQHADSYAIALARIAAEGTLPPRVYPPPGIEISFVHPPTSGPYAGRSDAVRVEARRNWSPPLPWLFGRPREMKAFATAARPRMSGTDERIVLRVE